MRLSCRNKQLVVRIDHDHIYHDHDHDHDHDHELVYPVIITAVCQLCISG